MRTKRPPGSLENKIRGMVTARIKRGERVAAAEAAGHKGPWLSNWIKRRQDATFDEIVTVAATLNLHPAVARLVATAKTGSDSDQILEGLRLLAGLTPERLIATLKMIRIAADVPLDGSGVQTLETSHAELPAEPSTHARKPRLIRPGK